MDDDLYVDTTDINTDINPVNLFNDILVLILLLSPQTVKTLSLTTLRIILRAATELTIRLLGPLQDNGGPTFTRALPSNSPAINVGDNGIVARAWPQHVTRGDILRIIDGYRGYRRI